MIQVAFYKAGNFRHYNDAIPLKTAISLFTSEKAIFAAKKIRRMFKDELAANFKGYEKRPYQNAKKDLFNSVIFSGTLDRATGQGEYNGLMTFDLDVDDADHLLKFVEKKPDFCLMHTWSVSGKPNGFAVFNTEATNEEEFRHISRGIKAYLKKVYKLDVPLSDHIRIRYIAGVAPQDIYVNYGARKFTLEEADKYYDEICAEEAAQSKIADDIHESDWVEFCKQYATANGHQLVKGQRHMYITYFAIGANLLGIPKENCVAAVNKMGIQLGSNAVSYPYSSYKSSFGKWGWRLHQQDNITHILKYDQYVHDLGIDFTGCILCAGTGTGKTYAATKLHEKMIIAVPYFGLCENIAAEYGYQPYNAQSRITDKPDRLVTTYASLRSLIRHLGKDVKDYHLVVDEAHNLTLSATRGFMLDDLNYIVDCMESETCSTTTFLSGTWLYNIHPAIRKMKVIRIEKERIAKELKFIFSENTLQTTIDLFRESVATDRFPFVLQNDTSMNRDTLVGGLDGFSVKSFTSRSKQDKDFLSIVKDSMIKEDIDGILTTTVLKEGNNINNQIDVDIIVVGSYHSSEIEQVSQRFRKAKSIRILIVKARGGVRSAEWGDARQFTWDQYKRASETLKTLDTISRPEESFRKLFDIYPFRYDNEFPELDYLLISNLGIRVETVLENRNIELMTKNLEQYSIKRAESEERFGALITNEVIENLKAKNKKEKEDNYYNRLRKLRFIGDPLGVAQRMERFEAHKLQQGEDIAIKYFVRICRYHTPKTVLQYMMNLAPVKNQLNKLENYFLFNAAYHVSIVEDSIQKKFFADMLEYCPQEILLPDIADTIVALGEKHGVGTSRIEQELIKWETEQKSQSNCFPVTRALLDAMFHVKTQRVRLDGARITKYTLRERQRVGNPSDIDFQTNMLDFIGSIVTK